MYVTKYSQGCPLLSICTLVSVGINKNLIILFGEINPTGEEIMHQVEELRWVVVLCIVLFYLLCVVYFQECFSLMNENVDY